MKHYQTFIFDSYDFDGKAGKIKLRYSLDDEIRFTETVTVPQSHSYTVAKSTLEASVFSLHLIGGISYFKTCIPPKIEVRSGTLTKEQADFWNTVYEKGLGEFCYKNKLPPTGFVHFEAASDQQSIPSKLTTNNQKLKTLVPVGGGKDSIVTMEKLRAEGRNITLFRMGSHPLIEDLVKVAGLSCITVERRLPRTLFELNEQGALNGHVPITAYLSCLCVVVAKLFGFEEIAMSCENSASIGNVHYQGVEINHQWSKGEEFERIFQDYILTSIDPNLRYWSPLRDRTELEIVSEFVKHPQYFPVTTSCNRNWKILGERPSERWCGVCPKCAFAFSLFAAYLPKETLLQIFGKNLFADVSLIPLYEELLGLRGCKPFECVGPPEEVREAFRIIHERGEFSGTPIMSLCASVT